MSLWARLFNWRREPPANVGSPDFEGDSHQAVQKLESAGRALDRALAEALGAVDPNRNRRSH